MPQSLFLIFLRKKKTISGTTSTVFTIHPKIHLSKGVACLVLGSIVCLQKAIGLSMMRPSLRYFFPSNVLERLRTDFKKSRKYEELPGTHFASTRATCRLFPPTNKVFAESLFWLSSTALNKCKRFPGINQPVHYKFITFKMCSNWKQNPLQKYERTVSFNTFATSVKRKHNVRRSFRDKTIT